jgi:dTDP-4-amino-4,6-dideoxygalactose transaminase
LRQRRWPLPPTSAEASAILHVAARGPWTDGPYTEEVEVRLADITGAPHAVAFNSCTSAIHAALLGLGAAPGSPVTVPSLTFAGTLTGASHIGCKITFGEIRPDTLTLAHAPANEGITLAVDLHGVPHTLQRGPNTLTDSCQALGTLANGRHLGAAGTHAWSFSAAKLITAPDGGAVTTDDPDLADVLRELRDYGTARKAGESRANAAVVWPGGHNWRPSELSMAMVAHRLRRLPEHAQRAAEVAGRVHESLDAAGYWRQQAPIGAGPAWHKIRFGRPGWPEGTAPRLAAQLDAAGIPVHQWGRLPLHRHPAFLPDDRSLRLPLTDMAAADTLCLGTEECPPLTWTDDETEHVCHVLETLGD